jgi:hypothetical protein
MKPWINQMLGEAPQAGGGLHRWIFVTALKLRAIMPASMAFDLLASATRDRGRNVPDRELRDAVSKAYSTPAASLPYRGSIRAPKRWPEPNPAAIRGIVANGGGLADLWEASPQRLDCRESATESLIDALFPCDCLLCAGPRVEAMRTRPRDKWRGLLSSLLFIVPNPMLAQFGTTSEGRRSERCLGNTGPRRFVVVEFDFATDGPTWQRTTLPEWEAAGRSVADANAALLLHLRTFAPLAIAVHSGNKSIHGWFHVAGWEECRLRRFLRYACQGRRESGGERAV